MTTDMEEFHDIDIPSDISRVPPAWLTESSCQDGSKMIKWEYIWSSGTGLARMGQLYENMFIVDDLKPIASDQTSMTHEHIMAAEAIKVWTFLKTNAIVIYNNLHVLTDGFIYVTIGF